MANTQSRDYPTVLIIGTDGKEHKLETGWEDDFLESYAKSGNITLSANQTGIHQNTVRKRRELDAQFAIQMKEAQETAIEILEAAAWHRARDGVKRTKGIYFNGRRVGEEIVTEYSDTLLIFLLKANKPDKYRETITHRYDVQAARDEARRLAEKENLPIDEVMAEFDRIMQEGRS